MKVAAVLCVKDEVELIGRTIDHLWAIGVDRIAAFDLGSTDGTRQILADRGSAALSVVDLDDRDPDTTKIFGAIVAEVGRSSADWVLFQDADEFWIPATGSIKDCASLADADVLSVPRFNVPLGAGGPLLPEVPAPAAHQATMLIVKAMPDFRRRLDVDPSLPWIRAIPKPKPMARPGCVTALTEGLHHVVAAPGVQLRKRVPNDLVIAHLPFSTATRFARKVDNIRAQLAVHAEQMAPETAWHWRRWLRLADQGLLEQEFERTVFESDTLEALRAEGWIRSAAEWFADATEARGP